MVFYYTSRVLYAFSELSAVEIPLCLQKPVRSDYLTKLSRLVSCQAAVILYIHLEARQNLPPVLTHLNPMAQSKLKKAIPSLAGLYGRE